MFESFGVVAEVVTDDRRVFGSLPSVLPPDWQPAGGPVSARFGLTGEGRITLDGPEVANGRGDREAALLKLGATVRHQVAVLAPDHVFIHAGVVRAGDTSIVIPGGSRSGKSTLVAELLAAGATYYSDEYAPVGSDGLIQPYAKPLSIRPAGRDGPGRLRPVPQAQIATRPAAPGLIVVTRYEAGAAWRPRPVSGGEAALALLRNTVAARPQSARAMSVVSQLARDASSYSSARGEARDTAPALMALARARTRRDPLTRHARAG